MHDVRLPLIGTLGDGLLVRISQAPVGHLTQIAGWDDFAASAQDLLGRFGLLFSEDYQTVTGNEKLRIWRIAPDRLLMQSQDPFTIQSAAALAVLDLTDARVGLKITGAGAAGMLARVTALDYAPNSFANGSFRQTALHHIGVLIERRETDHFDLLVPTSWTQSVIDLLAEHIISDVGSTK